MQPCDALINKEFKLLMKKYYPVQCLNSDNKKASREQLLTYVYDAWNNLDPDVLTKSFLKTVMRYFELEAVYMVDGSIK